MTKYNIKHNCNNIKNHNKLNLIFKTIPYTNKYISIKIKYSKALTQMIHKRSNITSIS